MYLFRIQAYFSRSVDADAVVAVAVVIIVAMAIFFFLFVAIICLSRGISFNCYLCPSTHMTHNFEYLLQFACVSVLLLRQSVLWILCARESNAGDPTSHGLDVRSFV